MQCCGVGGVGRGRVEVAISDWGWVEETPSAGRPFYMDKRIFAERRGLFT